MPGFDGTGPQGRGPMTGWARGYCVLRESNNEPIHMQGFAGVQGTPVDVEILEGKEVVDMPLQNRVGPMISRPMVGRPVVYPGWGNANPLLMGTVPPLGLCQAAPDMYRRSWWGSGFWWAPFGRRFGPGRGWGRGRGRFGCRW
ncbi:MAG: DUF5320 domain-containing protein [Phycisphaerae bacterium]|nr:DUF5320 domain-containing protein [Phycisphaerae bacterium]